LPRTGAATISNTTSCVRHCREDEYGFSFRSADRILPKRRCRTPSTCSATSTSTDSRNSAQLYSIVANNCLMKRQEQAESKRVTTSRSFRRTHDKHDSPAKPSFGGGPRTWEQWERNSASSSTRRFRNSLDYRMVFICGLEGSQLKRPHEYQAKRPGRKITARRAGLPARRPDEYDA
jgi:hypothetical protein